MHRGENGRSENFILRSAFGYRKKKIDPEAGERKILQLGPTMIRLHVTQRKKELEIPKTSIRNGLTMIK